MRWASFVVYGTQPISVRVKVRVRVRVRVRPLVGLQYLAIFGATNKTPELQT